MKNAAEEKSPGTLMRAARNGCSPVNSTVLARRHTGAPNAPNMSSVWSRVVAGSVIRVMPRACSAASRIADLTWALGMGSV